MQYLRRFLADDFTVTKRLLGYLMAGAGGLGTAGVFAFDALTGGADFGPSQQLALAAMVAALLVGLSLIPLGDRPA